MKFFPISLRVENKDNFRKLYLEKIRCQLRDQLYTHIISSSESDYFALNEFIGRIGDKTVLKAMITQIMGELEELGWNCTLTFGDTGLFIYSDVKPSNCWNADIIENVEL
jgi:hypothetical protein